MTRRRPARPRPGSGLALALLFAPLPAAAASLSLRISPPDAVVYLEGRELSTSRAANGVRVAAIEPGERSLILLADGCVARRLCIAVPSSAPLPLVEAKLERCGSPLVREDEGRTGLRPKSVAYTPDGRTLVLPLLSGRGADLLDAATLAPVGRLEPPEAYAALEGFVESAFLPDRREIWVSQMHNGTIHAFDLDTFAYKGSFPSGGAYPKVIALSPDGLRAYVSNWVSEEVSVIDAATRRVLARVKTGGTPRGLAPSPDGRWLYVARFSDGAILRLDLGAMRMEVLRGPDGGAKRHLVLDAARGRLYATDMGRGSLFVVDAAQGRLVAELPLGKNPNGCALSPDGRLLYACTRGPDGEYGYEKKGPVSGEIVVFDAERLVELGRQWGGAQPTGLAVAPDGSRVVFTDFLDHRVEAYRFDPSR